MAKLLMHTQDFLQGNTISCWHLEDAEEISEKLGTVLEQPSGFLMTRTNMRGT